MVTLIPPDKILSSSTGRSSQTDDKNINKSPSATSSADSSDARPAETSATSNDTVEVGQASELYRQSNTQSAESSSNIGSPEAAIQLATRIAKQIAEGGAQALQAQTGALSNHTGALLQIAPA